MQDGRVAGLEQHTAQLLGSIAALRAGIKTILDSVGIEYDAEKAKKVTRNSRLLILVPQQC